MLALPPQISKRYLSTAPNSSGQASGAPAKQRRVVPLYDDIKQAGSRPTCQCRREWNMRWSSTWTRRRRSDWQSRPRCSLSPTRWSNSGAIRCIPSCRIGTKGTYRDWPQFVRLRGQSGHQPRLPNNRDPQRRAHRARSRHTAAMNIVCSADNLLPRLTVFAQMPWDGRDQK